MRIDASVPVHMPKHTFTQRYPYILGIEHSYFNPKKKKYFGHKVAADHGLEIHFSLSVLSRCLTFDIMKSQDIVASRADKRAAFTVHLTSLFERQINFL